MGTNAIEQGRSIINSERLWERFLTNPREDSTGAGSAWILVLAGKSVLVTGAGGFIGSALVETIATAHPRSLILLDSSEHNLFEIQRRLQAAFPAVPCHAVLGSVENAFLLNAVFSRFHPQIIFHAAAFKHVPLLELNPFSALRNNALATYALAQAASRYGSGKLLLISTDKAVHPHSIMGVSKRIAELITVSLSSPACRMNAVRLVNVIGSSGSVVPIFREQIEKRKPVLVTHPEASRYFLSLHETLHAILACAVPAEGGSVFLPEVGEPIRIAELAQFLIRMLGEGDSAKIPILFTSLRPGDKLQEDLISRDEVRDGCMDGPLAVIKTPKWASAQLDTMVKDLSACVASHDHSGLLQVLSSIVPEYVPSKLMLDGVMQAEQR